MMMALAFGTFFNAAQMISSANRGDFWGSILAANRMVGGCGGLGDGVTSLGMELGMTMIFCGAIW